MTGKWSWFGVESAHSTHTRIGLACLTFWMKSIKAIPFSEASPPWSPPLHHGWQGGDAVQIWLLCAVFAFSHLLFETSIRMPKVCVSLQHLICWTDSTTIAFDLNCQIFIVCSQVSIAMDLWMFRTCLDWSHWMDRSHPQKAPQKTFVKFNGNSVCKSDTIQKFESIPALSVMTSAVMHPTVTLLKPIRAPVGNWLHWLIPSRWKILSEGTKLTPLNGWKVASVHHSPFTLDAIWP